MRITRRELFVLPAAGASPLAHASDLCKPMETLPMFQHCASRRVTVTHPPGLHARPSLSVVKTLQRFQAKVVISNGSQKADARDILQVMSLGAPHGAELALSAEGSDAEEALDALQELFADNFGFGEE